jgi:hypothetical protein
MFSAEDQKKLAPWFKQIAELTKKCHACGAFDEGFTHPDLVCTPVAARGERTTLDNALYFLVRECRACGYAMLFNAERIGIKHA